MSSWIFSTDRPVFFEIDGRLSPISTVYVLCVGVRGLLFLVVFDGAGLSVRADVCLPSLSSPDPLPSHDAGLATIR